MHWRDSQRRPKYTFLRVVACLPMLGIIYLASYAPYLQFARLAPDTAVYPYYRSPPFYRVAEWCLVNTPARPIQLWWARCFNVEFETEMQAYYFNQGISDPESAFHFNILH